MRMLCDRWIARILRSLPTKQDLAEMEKRIMSAISDYTGKVQASFQKISDGVDKAVTSVQAIGTDIQKLNDLISRLQNSPGAISADDQKLLDQTQTAASALADKISALDDSLAKLDANTATPPTPPPTTPTTPATNG